MSDTREMRLAKAALVYNVSIEHIVEALRSQDIHIERTPTFKLSAEMIDILERNFNADKEIRRHSDSVKSEPDIDTTKGLDNSTIQTLEVKKSNDPTIFEIPKKKREVLQKRSRTKVASSSDGYLSLWNIFKETYPVNTELEIEVHSKVPPGFIFFKITDEIQGSLHVSELNWNFGLSQLDFRNIQVGSSLKVYVIGFDNSYRKVYLGRKHLPSIEKPSASIAWENTIPYKETGATVFEEFRSKLIIQLDSGLFGTAPLIEGRSYTPREKIQVIPVRKVLDQNIIECTLSEIVSSSEQQSAEVIEAFNETASSNAFSTSEFHLNSFQQLSESLYWNYFSESEQELLKKLFDETENLFSKVEKGEQPIHLEFDFGFNAYRDFVDIIAPAIWGTSKSGENATEKELLTELSKLNFWYTHFDNSRRQEGTTQSIVEKTFSLFNESISIRGVISDEGSMKIRFIKAKVKTDLLKEKQSSLKRYDVFFVSRPIIFAQYSPANTFNKDFVYTIDNKLVALKIFEVAKSKSLDILQKQGKEFKIFTNFLESQIDFEVKSSNDTELQLKDCKLELDIQTDGITFTGNTSGECEIKIGDKVVISCLSEDQRPQSIGVGAVLSIENGRIKIKSSIENYELLEGGCSIKKNSSTRQYWVQLEILNKFFLNQLPLDTFYKVFHDRDGIEAPENVEIDFINKMFAGKESPQTLAVKKAIGNKNILLIQGPPGTGKTTVITEIVKQLIKRGKKVLVTSQTHIAVDNVLERVKDDTKINIARIGNQDTISDFAAEYLIDEARKRFSDKAQKIVDIKIELLNHQSQGRNISEFSEQNFDLPLTFDWQNIQDFIALIQGSDQGQTTLMIESLEQWKDVIAKSPQLLTDMFFRNLNVLFGTCIGIATNKELQASEIFFDTVILDEAGKANISETLTAISRAKEIILVGDHKQLPPYLDSERVEYFKKFSRDFVEQRLTDNEIKQALGGSFFEYLQREGVLNNENKILLAEQHRMHPDIGNFVSESFYNSELLNGEHTKENVIPLQEPFDKQIIFIDTSSDKSSSESFEDGSYFNKVEAEFIVHKVIPELERGNVSPKSFAIVSPYSKQCEKIRELITETNSNSYGNLEVATLDSFQGREHDVIIFSFTRSAFNKKVGFLDDARRLNVAFSRAKKKLILIGNSETLRNQRSHYDQYYTSLFNNLWRYAGKYGRTYRINELDFSRLQNTLIPGEIKKARVKRIQDKTGVFIGLGKKDGLIPISLFSAHPSKYLEINQEVEVVVKWIDADGKITLSLVNSGNNAISPIREKLLCYRKFKSEHQMGDVVEGKVIKINSLEYGKRQVIIEFEFSATGVAYIKEIKIKLEMNQKVKFKIKEFNEEKSSLKGSIVL